MPGFHPHPNPLPQGEGILQVTSALFMVLRTLPRVRTYPALADGRSAPAGCRRRQWRRIPGR